MIVDGVLMDTVRLPSVAHDIVIGVIVDGVLMDIVRLPSVAP